MTKLDAIKVLSLYQEFGKIIDVSEEFDCDYMFMFEDHVGSIKYKNNRFYPENDGVWSIEGFSTIEESILFLKDKNYV